jgi:cytochrome c oxidase cbb3-type subunit III
MMAEQNDFDGIKYREEQKSPAVFRLLFYGLAIWGLVFMGYYLFSGWSSQAEFAEKKKTKEEMLAKAPAPAAPHAEGKKEDYVAKGKALYDERCAACHGAQGKGGIGPDLTAGTFKFGRDVSAVTASISEGRPGGMPEFKSQLTHEQIEAVAQFVLSLK